MKTLILALFVLSSAAQADGWYVSASFEHTSNPLIREQGYGLNAGFVDLTYKSKIYFISVGLGYHNESMDCPEICFGSGSLARLRFGVEVKIF